MFPLAGQTAGPNKLTFFVDTHGLPGSVIGLNQNISLHSRIHNIFKDSTKFKY